MFAILLIVRVSGVTTSFVNTVITTSPVTLDILILLPLTTESVTLIPFITQ